MYVDLNRIYIQCFKLIVSYECNATLISKSKILISLSYLFVERGSYD